MILSKKNEKTPDQVTYCAKETFWFNCPECGCEVEELLCNISDNGCSCCTCTKKIMCKNYDCEVCFKKSFASVEESMYWSEENEVTPRQVCRGSKVKYMFNCNDPKCGHKFEKSLDSISGKRKK